MKIAVFPGSFDPITLGHHDILLRALPLFDQIIIAIGNNSQKKYFYPVSKRKDFIDQIYGNQPKIITEIYTGLTIDFCKKRNASYILRGLRTNGDFEFEKYIAQMNLAMADDIETVFLISRPVYSGISSTIVRDILVNGGDASVFVPPNLKL